MLSQFIIASDSFDEVSLAATFRTRVKRSSILIHYTSPPGPFRQIRLLLHPS